MAKGNRNEIAVGITVSVVLVLTIYVVVMLADWTSMFTEHKRITVKMPYKAGLKGLTKGSPISLGGVKIGQITDTGIEPPCPDSPDGNDINVFFTMKIPQRYCLRRDCVLESHSNMLGGQVLLAITDLGTAGPVVQDGQTVELLLAETMMEAIQREFDTGEPNSILARVKREIRAEDPTSILARFKGEIDANDPNSLLASIKKELPAVTQQLLQTLKKADTALETAQATLKNIKEFTQDERLDRIVDNITEVSTDLKLTAREVRRAPWKLLYKPKAKEVKIQALVDSAGAFAAGAERLDATAMRLQRLALNADGTLAGDKERLDSMLAELQTSFEQFQKAEEKFWQELK